MQPCIHSTLFLFSPESETLTEGPTCHKSSYTFSLPNLKHQISLSNKLEHQALKRPNTSIFWDTI